MCVFSDLFYSKGVLKKIIEAATAETTARTLCQLGDNLIEEETNKVYKKEKELKKGILFYYIHSMLSSPVMLGYFSTKLFLFKNTLL